MKLYTARMAPNPRRVSIFLAEKGLTDRIEQVVMELSTDAKTPEHLARNHLGQLPVLELDDGRFLSESRAICTYLEAIAPEPNLMGTTPEERAFIEAFDRKIEFQVLWPLANWVRHGHPGLVVLEKTQVADWAALSETKARAAMAWLDDDLSQREWVAGGRFTIADITCFCAIEFARLMKFKPWEEHANIARWREAMRARPSMAAV
jgi:glutathione S-transferase